MKFSDILTPSGTLDEILKNIRDGKSVSVFGVPKHTRRLITSLCGGCAYVFADVVEARQGYEELAKVCDAVFLPPPDDALSYRVKQSADSGERLKAMAAAGSGAIIVTCAAALAAHYPLREKFSGGIITVEKGGEYSMTRLREQLAAAGYRREDQVIGAGTYAVRGDILDVWSPGDENGVRIEFFGDVADRLRRFDAAAQSSIEDIDSVRLCPSTVIFLQESDAERVAEDVRAAVPKKAGAAHDRASAIASDLSMRLSAGDRGAALEYVLPLCPHQSFFEFFAPSSVVYDDSKAVYDSVCALYSEHAARRSALLERGEYFMSADALAAREKVFESGCGQLAYHSINSNNRIFSPQKVFELPSVPIADYSRSLITLADDISAWLSNGYSVTVCCGADALHDSVAELLREARIGFGASAAKGRAALTTLPLLYGGLFHEQKTVVIGVCDISRRPRKKTLSRSKRDVFSLPQVGDYVVHEIHGIGFCEAISRMELGGAKRDYAVVRYAGTDKLYVPIENIDCLSRLISSDEHPRLSKIGGSDFSRIKEKVKQSVKAMAVNLLELYAQRSNAKGHAYSADNSLLEEFEADFGYTETDDQLTAVREGLGDLIGGKIMDRLLCGDVGYGKTEVALRLAFKVICEGKQVAFVSPTTILAKQHCATVKARMERFGIKVGSLTRFDSAADVSRTVDGLASGEVDIVCGTHRVLSKDVKFRDLGLLILDEEQRFGVADKEKIKSLKINVNVLSLSATPIPRTLHMSMVGIRDISVLDTPPAERIPVQTYVSEYTEALAYDAVMREIGRGGQVFVVYNRVAGIDKFAASLQRVVPNARILVAHGQMSEGALERVIDEFTGGEGDVLVASTIIENGIDMPRANTMIVIDSDRLGLSQLYQLRGRVGRSNRLAYVYFTYDGAKMLTETAYKRLDAITEYTEFGSGFKIAMRDLEIRGAGNILGREQHGHIEKVGYDLYCKLLKSAVAELSGAAADESAAEVKVLTDFDAYIPHEYVPDEEWRLKVYGRVSALASDADLKRLSGELADIYGPVPSAAANLMYLGLVKNLAARKKAVGVTMRRTETTLDFSRLGDVGQTSAAVSLKGDKVRLSFGAGADGRKKLMSFLSQ